MKWTRIHLFFYTIEVTNELHARPPDFRWSLPTMDTCNKICIKQGFHLKSITDALPHSRTNTVASYIKVLVIGVSPGEPWTLYHLEK